MGIPDVKIKVSDGGTGATSGSSENVHAKIGVCSLGIPNTVYAFNDKDTMRVTLGVGPLVQDGAYGLDVAGGPCLFVPVTASIAGTNGAVTRQVDASVGGTFAVTGAPNDDYQIIVRFILGAATVGAGTATFQVSTDNGNTWSAILALPVSGTYAIPGTGMSFSVTNGGTAIVAGDRYSWTAKAPSYTSLDLVAALTALFADPRRWRFAEIIGQASTATASATLAATISSAMQSAETAFRYAFAMLQAADDTDANLTSAFANFASARTMVCAGFADLTSSLDGTQEKRPASWIVAARCASAPLSEHLGRVASGPLPGVQKLYRDEQATPGLDAARFTTLRSHIGLQGFYITRGNLMAATASDYAEVQARKVMDRACELEREKGLQFLNDTVRVNPATVQAPLVPGAIYENDAQRIEAAVGKVLSDELVAKGHASSARIVVNRSTNLISSGRLPIKVRVVPDGYLEEIDFDTGFENPALALN
jgi:hypothetical protein